jgi:hypothetical protein
MLWLCGVALERATYLQTGCMCMTTNLAANLCDSALSHFNPYNPLNIVLHRISTI